jgi:zinc protease
LVANPIDKSGFFFAGAIAAPANMDKGMTSMLAEIETMVKSGVSEAELTDAKKSYAKVWEGRLADDDFVLGELNQGLFVGRTLAYWSDLNRKIAKLTVADVNAAMRQFIDPTKLAKVRAGDQAKKK